MVKSAETLGAAFSVLAAGKKGNVKDTEDKANGNYREMGQGDEAWQPTRPGKRGLDLSFPPGARSPRPGSAWASELCRRWRWGWCSQPAQPCMTTTTPVSPRDAQAAREFWDRCPRTGPQEPGAGKGVRESWGSREQGLHPHASSSILQSTSVLCSMGRRVRAGCCPPCALLTSASALRGSAPASAAPWSGACWRRTGTG